jgi:hypothetical protein
VQPDEYRAFTHELTERLRADGRAIGLVAVGSMADRDYPPDEWSDHDFFVITPLGGQEELRNDLSWLPYADRVALSFRETEHGLNVISTCFCSARPSPPRSWQAGAGVVGRR